MGGCQQSQNYKNRCHANFPNYTNMQKVRFSKMGVIMLSKHLATHLAPNIRVNTVCLGGIENKQSEKFKERYSKKT